MTANKVGVGRKPAVPEESVAAGRVLSPAGREPPMTGCPRPLWFPVTMGCVTSARRRYRPFYRGWGHRHSATTLLVITKCLWPVNVVACLDLGGGHAPPDTLEMVVRTCKAIGSGRYLIQFCERDQ
jgi:hypothetical protein